MHFTPNEHGALYAIRKHNSTLAADNRLDTSINKSLEDPTQIRAYG